MQSLPFSKIRRIVISITFLIIALGIGYNLGQNKVGLNRQANRLVINREAPESANIDFSLFWDAWNRIHRYYIDQAQIDNQKLVWGAISGMVNAVGDPYTVFLTPKENTDFKDDLGGAFEGIGAQLSLKDEKIIVVAPLKGSPAEASGIRVGDWIIKVNDEDTFNWSVAQAVSKIRGPKNTKVTLNILHDKDTKPVDIVIVRDTIKIPSVEFWVKKVGDIDEISSLDELKLDSNSQIAYLELTRFGDRLNQEWALAVKQLTDNQNYSNISGLVFDLRNNPGGYLDGSVYIASEFIKNGLVVSQVNSDGSTQTYNVNRSGKLYDIPMVVLINKGSASASEIVAGALQDYKRATIIGETSFGKGSVQTPQDLSGGSGLHITTGKWLTPKGNSITKKGISPDIEVKYDYEEASRDAQLAKAIEFLLNK